MNFPVDAAITLPRNKLPDRLVRTCCAPVRPDSLRAIAWRYNWTRLADSVQRFSGWARISPVTDLDLIDRARAGEREAFGVLVERYGSLVRRLCRTVLGHADDADDAAQNALLSAWNALDRFDRTAELGPWLARIALNAARDLRRRRKLRTTEPIPLGLTAEGPGPEVGTDRELLGARLREALATLPERQRVALILFEVEGYAQTEISLLLGAPEGTIRSEIFHARRRLRALLGAAEESPA